MPSRRAVAFALVLASGLPVTAACASGGDGGLAGGGGSASVSDYLAQLPAADDPSELVLVNYADLARATELGGLERPDDPTDVDAMRDWLQGVTGQVPAEGHAVAALPPSAADITRATGDEQGFIDDVGWSILDVDSYAERDTLPARVTVMDGRFDGDRMAGALDDAGDGVWLAGDPDGDLHVDDITPARPVGEPLWLSLDGHRLRVTREEKDVAPEGDTLADDDALAALAGALDDHDVYSAMLAAGPNLGSSAVVDDIINGERPDLAAGCQGMTGAAVGVADDGDPLIVLAITQTGGDGVASDNAAKVKDALESGADARSDRPWSDLVTVDSVEAEDGVVVATMRPTAGMILGGWFQFLLARSFPPC